MARLGTHREAVNVALLSTRYLRPRPQGLVKCDQCYTPAYRVVGDTIVIEHRHDGQKHVTVVTRTQLLDMMQS